MKIQLIQSIVKKFMLTLGFFYFDINMSTHLPSEKNCALEIIDSDIAFIVDEINQHLIQIFKKANCLSRSIALKEEILQTHFIKVEEYYLSRGWNIKNVYCRTVLEFSPVISGEYPQELSGTKYIEAYLGYHIEQLRISRAITDLVVDPSKPVEYKYPIPSEMKSHPELCHKFKSNIDECHWIITEKDIKYIGSIISYFVINPVTK
jgi:hypothetical protein